MKGNMYIGERGAQDRHQSESDDDGEGWRQQSVRHAAADDYDGSSG